MFVNLSWTVALLGCTALFLFWCGQCARTLRSFGFLMLGFVLIIGATFYQQEVTNIPNVVGLALALLVLGLLVLCLVRLSLARRRTVPSYQAPRELRGKCSCCSQIAPLKQYKQGWLCATCARRQELQAA